MSQSCEYMPRPRRSMRNSSASFSRLFVVFSRNPAVLPDVVLPCLRRLFTFHAFAYEQAPSIFYAAMNLSVHAVMYAYYAFAATRVRPNPIPAILLTSGQLAQMAVGVAIHGACFYLYYAKGNIYNGMQCGVSIENAWAGVIMYLSYFVLFLKLFVDKYVRGKEVNLGIGGGPRQQAGNESGDANGGKKRR